MKLMSQLFGDRMFVTSATGCAYVVGSSTPSFPYVANEKGHGPANSNSLFEDNAEYALGMKLSIDQMRRQMAAHAGSQDMVQTAEADIVSPAVAAVHPDALLGQRILIGLQAGCCGSVRQRR